MRRPVSLGVILFLLFLGGGITVLLSGGNTSRLLPTSRQTSDPAASTLEAETWQADQLFLCVLMILLGVISIGTLMAFIMWLLSRQIASARRMPRRVVSEVLEVEDTPSS